MIHVAKYLAPNAKESAKSVEQELESLLDLLQPGWRDALIERRFLPGMTVANAVVDAERGGFAGRPDPAVTSLTGLFVAGDWVGAEGMLADASFASAKRAAQLAKECVKNKL
jgi:phytoene dehydrogenase-like protein